MKITSGGFRMKKGNMPPPSKILSGKFGRDGSANFMSGNVGLAPVKREPKRNYSNISNTSHKSGQSKIYTPKLNGRNMDKGKMKLRDKRMMRLNIERRKISDKAVNKDYSPGTSTSIRGNAVTPTKPARGDSQFFSQRNKDKRMRSPFVGPKRGQSKLKVSKQRGRNQNCTTIDPVLGIRSQSPNIVNPMIQIKYETNNYYPQISGHTSGLNEHMGNSSLAPNLKMKNSTLATDVPRNLLSPQPGHRKDEYNFYPPNMNRVGSPVQEKQNMMLKSPVTRA